MVPKAGTTLLGTSGGFGICNGYVTVSSNAPVPSLYATTWTEMGVLYLDTATVYPLSARDSGQTVVITGNGGVDMVMWGVIDVNISGTTPLGLVHYVAKRDGNNHSLWINGKLFGTATSTYTPLAANGIAPAIGSQAGSGGNAGLGALASTRGVLSVTRFPITFPDTLCLAMSRNVWNIFSDRTLPVHPLVATATTQRAIILQNGVMTQIVDALIGTNMKPLVLYQGQIQQRVASEGAPIVLAQGQLRVLAANETLIL
jgi:hypothetical protein